MERTRLLLAEDDADHQRLLLMALAAGRPTVDVLATSSRDELIHAAQSGEFDCIVLDFNLPPYTAPEVIQDLAQYQPETPVVVVSSSEEQSVVIEALRVGVGDFVPKEQAVEGDALWQQIERTIAKARAERAERREADRRLKSMERAADTDPLTGLYNRRYADRALRSTRFRGDRRASIAGVMIDLDHFKHINDTLGHAAGDAVLERAAGALRDAAGPSDTVIRWGGEEFFVLKQSATLAAAAAWACAFCRDLSNIEIQTPAGPTRITASVGVAALPSSEFGPGLTEIADRALYLAKDLGRDRVCTWPMVRAMEVAEEIGASSRAGWWDRARQLLDVLDDDLGDVQRDHTGPHAERVRRMARTIGLARRLGRDPLSDLEIAACLHDLGKVGVPEELLAKPAKLTRDEKRFVDEHARFGGDLLRAMGIEDRIARIVSGHHDRFDAHDVHTRAAIPAETPLNAILTVADAVVSMRSPRPYADVRSIGQTLAELKRERGRQFDPDVVDSVHAVEPALLQAA